MNTKKIIFLCVALVVLAGASFWLFSGNKPAENRETAVGFGKRAMVLNIIGKTGSSADFFEYARQEFMKKYTDVEINYIGKGTFDAIDYILEHDDVDGWICADETAAEMLKAEYAKAHPGTDVVADVSPVVTSPLVFVGWEERVNKLGALTMNTLYDILSKGKNWGELGGDSNWGFFNFSHTNPVDSNSGMQFMVLLIHNYYNQMGTPKKDLSVEDVANTKIVDYIKAFEKNTAKQVEGTGKFIEMMIQFGPSKYDMGVLYEYYALSNIKNAQGRWGRLKVIYPNPTIWSNRPFVTLKSPKMTDKKMSVLKKFKEFLLSEDMQKKAMQDGYRPANTAVSDLSYLEKEFSSCGFKKDIASAVPAPGLDVIESIRNLAKRVQ